MHLDDLRLYCLEKPGAYEDQPFGPDVLVFKAGGKMFAITNLARLPYGVGLKCDPERGIELRERYDGVGTGPYLNGKHWNLVLLQSDVPNAEIRALVDHSYDLVVAGLPRRERERLAQAARTPGEDRGEGQAYRNAAG